MKAVTQKRLERERIKNKTFGNFSKFTGGKSFIMWQMRKMLAAIQSGDTNFSELISSAKPKVVANRANEELEDMETATVAGCSDTSGSAVRPHREQNCSVWIIIFLLMI